MENAFYYKRGFEAGINSALRELMEVFKENKCFLADYIGIDDLIRAYKKIEGKAVVISSPATERELFTV